MPTIIAATLTTTATSNSLPNTVKIAEVSLVLDLVFTSVWFLFYSETFFHPEFA